MQEIDFQTNIQEQILSYLEKESFFDIENPQNTQNQKLFKKIKTDLNEIIIKEKAPLIKKSEKNGTLNSKMIYFSENFLFYESNVFIISSSKFFKIE